MPVLPEVRAAPIDLPLNSSFALPAPAADSDDLPSVDVSAHGEVQHAAPRDSHEGEVQPMVTTVMPSGPGFDVVSQSLGNQVTETYID